MNPRRLTLMAAAGALGCALGLVLGAHTMMVSYLSVVVTLAEITMGALGVLLVTYLVRRQWTTDLHEPLRAAALMLPIVGVVFLPALAGEALIYPWAAEGIHSGAFQAGWLSPAFFALRTVAYFVVLTVVAIWATAAYRSDARMTRSASVSLILYALVASLAGVDWLESIEPHFHSSIFGLLFLTGTFLCGLAFSIAAVLWARRWRAPLSAYGSVLLACLLLWVYMHAMQYWIVWSGNLPDEMKWYLERLDSGWGVSLWALYILQFVLPFMALLSERVRARRNPLLAIAALTMALRFLETIVLLVPSAAVQPWLLLLDLPAAILLVGSLVALAWVFALPERLNRVLLAVPLPEILSSRRG